MKWIFRNVFVMMSLIAACNPCFSRQVHVIPSVKAALHYHSKAIGHIYIHMARFSSVAHAQNYRAFLINRTHFPVILVHRHHHYIVVIGPLNNAREARAIARNLLAKPKKVVMRHHEVPRPAIHVVTIPKSKPLLPTTAQPKATKMVERENTVVPTQLPTTSPGFFLSVGGGDQFNRISGNNSLNPGAGWPLDRYTSNDASDQPFLFLALGYTFERPNDWLPYYSFGLKYSYASASTVSGMIDQYSLPGFNNYNFQYDIQLMTILATAKANLYRFHNLMPYLSIGLGAVSYVASNYSEQALSGVTPRVSPAFGSNSGANFSSSIGVGMDYILLKNVWLNAEVNYNNYGKITTGNGANYATKTGTNYANESLGNSISATSVLLGVTYYPE